MRIAPILWLGATVAIGGLLMTLQTRPERRDTTTLRFDGSGAAARSELARRQEVPRCVGYRAVLVAAVGIAW